MASFAEKYKQDFDDLLALRIAAFFDVLGTQINITPKGGLGGKGHQEGEAAKAEVQARQPTVNFLVDLLNDINVQFLGAPPELTFVFRSEDEDDIGEVTTSRGTALTTGQKTLNDVMAESGAPLYEFAEADMPFIVVQGEGLVFLEGASVKPVPPPSPFGVQAPPGGPSAPGDVQPPPNPPSAPSKAPPDVDQKAEKAAELTAYRKFVAKGPRSREFVWAHHEPDEVKAVTADHPKAGPRLPGEDFRERLEQFYRTQLQQALADAVKGLDETIRRVASHRDKDASAADVQAAQQAIASGVTIDRDALLAVIREVYGDGYLAGSYVAGQQLGGGATLTSTLAAFSDKIDWDAWEPGWGEAAAKVSGGGLGQLLEQAEITLRGVTDSMMTRLGNGLAGGIDRGDSVEAIGRALRDVVGDPLRADTIAVTETARAMTAATFDTYQANDIAQWNLLIEDDACPVCEDIENDNPHDMGDDGPPYHPNCRCAASPVVAS